MKANRWIHLVNSAGFIWKPSEFFLTILSGILKSVISWESVVAWDGCFCSFEQGALPYCLQIRYVYLSDWWKSPPISHILQDQLSYRRSELHFFHLLWRENYQLSLNHGVITGSEKAGKRRNAVFAIQVLDWLQSHVLVLVWVRRGEERRDGENETIVFSLIKKTTDFLIPIHAKFWLISFWCFPIQNNWKQPSEGRRMKNQTEGG